MLRHLILGFISILQAFTMKSFMKNQYSKLVFDRSLLIKQEDPCDIFIVVFPGYNKNANSYLNLCNKIQKKTKNSNINVDFLILDYLLNIPFNGDKQCKYITDNLLPYFQNKNISYKSLYFMGHSAGSFFSIKEAKSISDGFIQLGSVLNSKGVLPWEKESLQEYPIPVLTLLAEKDGLMNPFYGMYEYDDMDNRIDIDKSIVIEKGVDHFQLSDGEITDIAKAFKQRNIYSNLNTQDAQKRIVNTVSNFLAWPYNETCFVELYDKVVYSKDVIDEYKSLEYDETNMISYIQYNVFKPKVFQPINVTVHKKENILEFLKSKPSYNGNGSFDAIYYKETILNPFYPYVSQQCCIKLKNQHSVKNDYTFKHNKLGKPITALDVNKKLIYSALESKKIDTNNVNIVFLEDKITQNDRFGTLNWLKEHVDINYVENNKTLIIQSPFYKNDDFPIEDYSNLYYMKTLTPQFAYELVTLYF